MKFVLTHLLTCIWDILELITQGLDMRHNRKSLLSLIIRGQTPENIIFLRNFLKTEIDFVNLYIDWCVERNCAIKTSYQRNFSSKTEMTQAAHTRTEHIEEFPLLFTLSSDACFVSN